MLGYAVIDCETTGLNIRKNDRIIEIAVVLLDAQFRVTGTYETILNPERDLGLVSLHGIDGLIASHGASFKSIMPALSRLLHDRIIVGHNVKFDIGMISEEYKRENVTIDFGIPIDTLDIARSLPFHSSNYKLGTLCEHFHIPLFNMHAAMADTAATAQLLIAMTNLYNLTLSGRPADFTLAPQSNNVNEWQSRVQIQEKVSSANLSTYIQSLQDVPTELPESSIDQYLKTLHLTLLNNRSSSWERVVMEEAIGRLSLVRSHVIDLNEEYIFMLLCKNLNENKGKWVDGENAKHLQLVSSFTGVREARVESLLRETMEQRHLITPTAKKLQSYFHFAQGDSFVLTGEDFQHDKSYWNNLLARKGYVSKDSTTKAVKLVLAGDPYSLSAKAAKARQYGIPVLAEDTLKGLLRL